MPPRIASGMRARFQMWSPSPTENIVGTVHSSGTTRKGLRNTAGEVTLSSIAPRKSRCRMTRSRSPCAVARVRT